jgi:diguanylate cyclase
VTDELTGVLSRRGLVESVEPLLADGRLAGATLLLIDLTGLKTVNEVYGYADGDRTLAVVADRARATLRPQDVIARLNGDQFAAVLPATGLDDALAVAGRLATEVSRPITLPTGHATVALSARAGVVVVPDNRPTLKQLLRWADRALTESRSSGETVRVFDGELLRADDEARLLREEFAVALECDQLELYYQPIMDLSVGNAQGVEALVRWQHPQRGLLTPDMFLDAIRATTLMAELTDWVLDEAVAAAARWSRTGLDVRVAVNLPPTALEHALPHHVAAVLRAAGIHPSRLVVEITEDAVVSGGEALQVLTRLRDLGVLIALDDFGTGYSSLTYLRELPADVVKLDRSFIGTMDADARSAAIVASVVQLAKALQMLTVAEGVETEHTARLVRELGINSAQGYLWSRPLPESEITGFLHGRTLTVPAVLAGQVDPDLVP